MEAIVSPNNLTQALTEALTQTRDHVDGRLDDMVTDGVESVLLHDVRGEDIDLNDFRTNGEWLMGVPADGQALNFPAENWTGAGNEGYLKVILYEATETTEAGTQILHKRGSCATWKRHFTSATAFTPWTHEPCSDIPTTSTTNRRPNMPITTEEIQKRIEQDGIKTAVSYYTEALKNGDIKPEDFSIRSIAECFLPSGVSHIEQFGTLAEGKVSPFANMITAVFNAKFMEGYNQEAFAMSKLVQTIPTQNDTEILYPFGVVVSTDLAVGTGEQYATAELEAQYIETPAVVERGILASITKEMILSDQTHRFLQIAFELGEDFAIDKETRILDLILGIKNTYKQNGTPRSTYLTGGTNQPWKNLLLGNELTNWENIERAELLFNDMVDPVNQNHMVVAPDTVLVMPPKRHQAHRLFYASSITYDDGSVVTQNPFGKYRVVSSQMAYRLFKSIASLQKPEKIWFVGNFRKAFAYMEKWGIRITALPGSGNTAFQFNISECGVPAVINPRYVVQSMG